MPDLPAIQPEEARYLSQKLYDGFYAFETLCDRDWNEGVCGFCGVCPMFESGDGNAKNCTTLSSGMVRISKLQ